MEIRRNNNLTELTGNDIRYLKFKNFDGHPDQFHPKGGMGNFTVVLTEEKAREIEEKFNGREEYALKVRWKPNRDDDLEPTLKVNINWDATDDKKPQIGQKTEYSNKITWLSPETIGCLNNAELINVSLLLNPSKGCGCYLRQGLFVIDEHDLFRAYRETVEDDVDEVY